ncbi:hypothetical protein N9Y86_02455 [Flavobacteriaceae bacterium]|nr:hypothetical protein [Flavobacteriaceae bacterium]
MRNLFTILISSFFFYSSAQTKLYVSPEADEYVAATKTIAIVPLKVEIKMRPKQLKDFTSEQITDMELDEAYNIQKSMYSWFLNKKKKGKLLVNIQSPKKTNKLLKDAGIDPNISHEELASDLSGILGVEAIITGTFETNKPMSNAAAIGLALLGVGGATQNVTLNLDIIHKDDEIVVNYLKNMKGGLGSSTDDLINVLMRKTARRIPYTD